MNNSDNFVRNLKRKISTNKDTLLFLCIGTNDIIWDSVGPLIGTYLKDCLDSRFVLGDIKNNIICYKDLICYSSKIKDKFIIAIDAAISTKEMTGEIFISNKPLIMGLGVNNNKGIIGDLSIKIAMSNSEKITREYVNNLAEYIARGIASSLS